MNVFVSWSGERSNLIAKAIKSWLPKVIQAADPWMSDEDIETGARWNNQLSKKLESSAIGIICITPENQGSQWLHFEAGALSKLIDESRVIPYIYGMSSGQLSGPLSQFQAVTCTKDGTKKIVQSLNDSLGVRKIPEGDLDEIFDVWWPKLDKQLRAVPAIQEHIPKRSPEDILEEILSIVREQRRRSENIDSAMDLQKEKMQQYMDKMNGAAKLISEKESTSSDLQKVLFALLTQGADLQHSDKPPTLGDIVKRLPPELNELIERQRPGGAIGKILSEITQLQGAALIDLMNTVASKEEGENFGRNLLENNGQ